LAVFLTAVIADPGLEGFEAVPRRRHAGPCLYQGFDPEAITI